MKQKDLINFAARHAQLIRRSNNHFQQCIHYILYATGYVCFHRFNILLYVKLRETNKMKPHEFC